MGKYYSIKKVKTKYGTYNRIIRTELGKQKLRETREIEKAYYQYMQDFKRTQRELGSQFEGVLIGRKEFRRRVKASREDNPEVEKATALEVYKKTLKILGVTTTKEQIFFNYVLEWYHQHKSLVDGAMHDYLVKMKTDIWIKNNPEEARKRKPTKSELKIPKVNFVMKNLRYDRGLKAAVLLVGNQEMFAFSKSKIKISGSLELDAIRMWAIPSGEDILLM